MKDSNTCIHTNAAEFCIDLTISTMCIQPGFGMLLPQNCKYKTPFCFDQRKKNKKKAKTHYINVLNRKIIILVYLVQEQMQTIVGKPTAGTGCVDHFWTITKTCCLLFATQFVAKTQLQPVYLRRKSYPPYCVDSPSLNLLNFHVMVFLRYCLTNILQS